MKWFDDFKIFISSVMPGHSVDASAKIDAVNALNGFDNPSLDDFIDSSWIGANTKQ